MALERRARSRLSSPRARQRSASAQPRSPATQQVRRLHAQFELAEGRGGDAAPAALGREIWREGSAALAATTPGQPRRKSRGALNCCKCACCRQTKLLNSAGESIRLRQNCIRTKVGLPVLLRLNVPASSRRQPGSRQRGRQQA